MFRDIWCAIVASFIQKPRLLTSTKLTLYSIKFTLYSCWQVRGLASSSGPTFLFSPQSSRFFLLFLCCFFSQSILFLHCTISAFCSVLFSVLLWLSFLFILYRLFFVWFCRPGLNRIVPRDRRRLISLSLNWSQILILTPRLTIPSISRRSRR